jgi:hypothetical protein
MQAVRASPTAEAMFALREAIDFSPVRVRLPDAGAQHKASDGTGLAYSPDGRRLAESSANGFVMIIDAASGQVVRRIKTGPSGLSSGSWGPDGSLLGPLARALHGSKSPRSSWRSAKQLRTQ